MGRDLRADVLRALRESNDTTLRYLDSAAKGHVEELVRCWILESRSRDVLRGVCWRRSERT